MIALSNMLITIRLIVMNIKKGQIIRTVEIYYLQVEFTEQAIQRTANTCPQMLRSHWCNVRVEHATNTIIFGTNTEILQVFKQQFY